MVKFLEEGASDLPESPIKLKDAVDLNQVCVLSHCCIASYFHIFVGWFFGENGTFGCCVVALCGCVFCGVLC